MDVSSLLPLFVLQKIKISFPGVMDLSKPIVTHSATQCHIARGLITKLTVGRGDVRRL